MPPPSLSPDEKGCKQGGGDEHAEIAGGEHRTEDAGADGNRVARTPLNDLFVEREDRKWEPEEMQNLKM